VSADLLPVFLKLDGRAVLVVGGGPVASSKLAALVAAGARVTVVAPEIVDDIRQRDVTCHLRPFAPADLDDAWLVVAAAPPAVNREVARLAEARKIFVNAVDDPANASVYLGGVVRRDGVTIAISTSGRAPAIAGLLREGIDALLPADLDRWLTRSDELRAEWRQAGLPMAERRPALLHALARLYPDQAGDAAAAGSRS